MTHQFFFVPGMWVGEGRMAFSTSTDTLRFYTRWQIERKKEGKIWCLQEVEMEGRHDLVTSRFCVCDVEKESFTVILENPLIGQVTGKGLITKEKIGWEFRGSVDFEGFEVYEIQEDGDYLFHAEYTAGEELRTIVDGRIWKKK